MRHLKSGWDLTERVQWCSAFTEANFPRCKAIALDMLTNGSERQFALKSLAQSLHYMGNHKEAKALAEEVRRDARTFSESSPVHPFVSMSIVLARIAYFEGRASDARELADAALAHALRDNAVSVCQVLAMGSIPVSVWSGDSSAALAQAALLAETAQIEQLGYWRVWGVSMLHSVQLRFDGDVDAGEFAADSLDALQSDHLAMLDTRTVSQLALDRVSAGLVGWTAPEILRHRALTTVWYDPNEARALLNEASELAEHQGSVAWVQRINETHQSLKHRLQPPTI